MPISTPSAGPPKVAINPAIPTQEDKWAGADIEGTYFANAGARGSLFVGLFVPLGVLLNNVYVGSKNAERAESLQDLTRINLAQLLKDNYLDLNGDQSEAEYLIQPYVVFYQENDEDIRTWCHINAKRKPFSDSSWKSIYRYSPDIVYKKSTRLPSPRELADCLRVSYDLFIEHIGGELEPFESATVKFVDVTIKGEVSKRHHPDRVITRDIVGVRLAPNSLVKSVTFK